MARASAQAHNPAVPGHIGGQDGSKSALDATLPRSDHGAALPCDLTPLVEPFRDRHRCAGAASCPGGGPSTRKIADPIAIMAGPRSPLGMFQVF